METKKRTIIVALAIAAVCSFAIGQVNAKGLSGVELGDTEVITALIVGIDKQDRTLTFIGPEGNVSHIEVGEAARNFDQIRVFSTS